MTEFLTVPLAVLHTSACISTKQICTVGGITLEYPTRPNPNPNPNPNTNPNPNPNSNPNPYPYPNPNPNPNPNPEVGRVRGLF